MDILRREFSLLDELLPYGPFASKVPDQSVSYDDRSHFIMIGSLMHAPNLDAARWCKMHIWPKIRTQLSGVELHCYGSYGERYAGELHAPKEGFHFFGRAEDALATMQKYRVNLAPLRYGAGLKGKIFDGFLTGTPTVMAPIASEGIYLDSYWGLDDTVTFADEAIRLYRDVAAWRERQQKERDLCAERFDIKTWCQRLPELMLHAYKYRFRDREANFIGQMLRHHQHRSTEFMSRWIEAKNR